ncbi:MAG TPA: tripartite tricarboxylate transporter substrate binding protein [Casimicrobiaceae bacterium]|nr:tripartite tricarboxylate transporter substrate binding protein [Casimicrobiaceae bacterium]
MVALRSSIVALAAASLAAFAVTGSAQDWPSKPIRMIVPYPPGGGTDIVARILNEKLAPELGQPIVIENKGGAGGSVGTEVAAHAPADGYTILLTLSSHTINPKLFPRLGYDVEKDFTPVSLVTLIPQIVVANPSLPVSNIAELVAYLKANPGKVNYASVGIGSPGHVAGELFKLKTGTQMTHVPYKGGGPAVTDTIGGQVQLLFVSIPAALQFVKQGRLKALAVTSGKRTPSAPDVPTIVENGGPDVVVDSWYGVLVPSKTPAPVVAKLNAAMAKVLAMPEVREKLFAQGAEAVWTTSADFDAMIRDELKKWEYVIRAAKITPE